MNRNILTLICLVCFYSYSQNKGINNIVGENYLIQSEILKEDRKVQIFLPEGYFESDKMYPVLYVLDGQKYFLHAISIQKTLVGYKQAPQFIVVGISKSISERNQNFSTNADAFLSFIEKEVIHLIDNTYRTSKKRLLFGWAYGGGFVIETLIKKSEIFDAYIAASPFPMDKKIKSLDSLFSKKNNIDKFLYFTSGTNEGIVKDGTHELNTFLTNKAPETIDWTFNELAGEEHRSTPFTTLYHGIKKRFNYYPELQFNNLNEFLDVGGMPYVYNYYNQRAKEYGFSNTLTRWTMFSLTRNAMRSDNYNQFDSFITEFKGNDFIGDLRVNRACLIAKFYAKHKKYDKAIRLYQFLIKKHPNSYAPLNGLADIYTILQKEKKASKYYEKAKQLFDKKTN